MFLYDSPILWRVHSYLHTFIHWISTHRAFKQTFNKTQWKARSPIFHVLACRAELTPTLITRQTMCFTLSHAQRQAFQYSVHIQRVIYGRREFNEYDIDLPKTTYGYGVSSPSLTAVCLQLQSRLANAYRLLICLSRVAPWVRWLAATFNTLDIIGWIHRLFVGDSSVLA